MDSSVYLRSLQLEDLERTLRWHNDPDVYALAGGPFRYVSRHSEEEWLRQKMAFSDREVNLAICLIGTCEHVGNLYLRDIDWIARRAELTGVIIGDPANRSKGYGVAALRLLIRHAFQDLGLVRLWGFVLARHRQSTRMLEKCGFVVEGTLRKHGFKQGTFEDMAVVGLCLDDVSREEWYETEPR